jgi:hypothetical protein
MARQKYHRRVVEKLLHLESINVRGESYRQTALIYASAKRHEEVV